jgi:ABC-type multidrug transport system fused ATPase/permease subunit
MTSLRHNENVVVDSRKPEAWPEDDVESSSTTQRLRHALFYSYMGPILNHGAALHKQRKCRTTDSDRNNSAMGDHVDMKLQELDTEHVYAVPKSMEAQHLAGLFWSARWNQQQDKQVHNMKQRLRGNIKKPTSSKSLTIYFLRILWILAKPTYLPAGICQFIAVICQCSLPLLVRAVLLRLESNMGDPFLRAGLPLAFAVFSISLIEGVANERQKFLSFQTGITLRSSVVSAVHEHVLAMTPRGRAGLTSGQINNLVAVDAQKLFELTQEGHYAWSCPLAMIIISVLLLLELGICALVGIVTMFLIVPFVHYIVNKMMSIRKRRVEASDARVEIITAMLQGIRFAKLNRYEDRFTERIMKLRRIETTYLKRELFYLSLTFVSTVLSPVLAGSFTFVAYVLVDDSHILTPSMTFTSLFLFAALRFPINYGGKLMGKAAQGFQACQRFGYFFERDSAGSWSNGSSDDARTNHKKDLNSIDRAILATPALKASVAGDVTKVKVGPMVDSSHARKIEQHTEKQTTFGNALECSPSSPRSANDLVFASSPLIDIMASFTIGEHGSSFTLFNIEMLVRKSQIICVVGPVASGKSVLVQGLIGELLPVTESSIQSNEQLQSYSGRCNVSGKIAYASQVPFILNATIRDNILFGEPYNEERYKRTLEACCLIPDIEMFHGKDLTEIGERGVTLSGGQKQRLAIARVAYSQPDVAVLDDPFSALDADTGRSVFVNLFQSPGSGNGLFDGTAVVLVTHAFHFLKMVDSILVLVNGKCAFSGEWGSLVDCHPKDPKEMDVIEAIRMSAQEAKSIGETKQDTSSQTGGKLATAAKEIKDQVPTSNDANGKIMSMEERQHGISQISTWLKWFDLSGGSFFAIVIFLAISFDRFMYVATEWWLAMWTQGAYNSIYFFGREYSAQSTEGSQSDYIITYIIILVVACIATVIRTTWITRGGAVCASRLFVLMLNRVVRAPMSYFDTTPIGRLMNRFTYDSETVDVTLVVNMTMLITSSGWLVAGIIIQSIIIPWLLIVLLFIVVNYWLLVSHYRKSAVDLQRLDAVSRSPVQAQLAEGMCVLFEDQRKITFSLLISFATSRIPFLHLTPQQSMVPQLLEFLARQLTSPPSSAPHWIITQE